MALCVHRTGSPGRLKDLEEDLFRSGAELGESPIVVAGVLMEEDNHTPCKRMILVILGWQMRDDAIFASVLTGSSRGRARERG